MLSFHPSQCNFHFHRFTGHLSTHAIPFPLKFDFAVLFYYSIPFITIVIKESFTKELRIILYIYQNKINAIIQQTNE